MMAMPQISQAQFWPALIRGTFFVWVVVDDGVGVCDFLGAATFRAGAALGAAFFTVVRAVGLAAVGLAAVGLAAVGLGVAGEVLVAIIVSLLPMLPRGSNVIIISKFKRGQRVSARLPNYPAWELGKD